MSVTKPYGVQGSSWAYIPFSYDDFGASGVEEEAFDMPKDALVVGGHLQITTPFNSGTSDTLTVGDEDDDDEYVAGVDGQAAARSALVPTGLAYTAPKALVIKWTGVGAAPSAGAGYLAVEYIRTGRQDQHV